MHTLLVRSNRTLLCRLSWEWIDSLTEIDLQRQGPDTINGGDGDFLGSVVLSCDQLGGKLGLRLLRNRSGATYCRRERLGKSSYFRTFLPLFLFWRVPHLKLPTPFYLKTWPKLRTGQTMIISCLQQTEDLKEIAIKIAALEKVNKDRPRIVVITHGKEPTLVVRGTNILCNAPSKSQNFTY